MKRSNLNDLHDAESRIDSLRNDMVSQCVMQFAESPLLDDFDPFDYEEGCWEMLVRKLSSTPSEHMIVQVLGRMRELYPNNKEWEFYYV